MQIQHMTEAAYRAEILWLERHAACPLGHQALEEKLLNLKPILTALLSLTRQRLLLPNDHDERHEEIVEEFDVLVHYLASALAEYDHQAKYEVHCAEHT